ncbi:MAG: NAD(P)/FAD-dependent oxidoreductase [Chroococcales cyanobacterium]
MSEQSKRICILGGGFGGLYTALRLSQLPWEKNEKPEIVLVDQNDRFVFSPLLYELVTDELQTWEIAPPFEELFLSTGVRFCQAKVTGIEIEGKQVALENRPSLEYDRLVIAMGATTPLVLVPGVQEYAIAFRNLNDVYALKERLRQLENSDAEAIRVAVVGAGYSGVELACKLADKLGDRGRIRLIELRDRILATATEFNRKAALKALEDRKIWIDLETSVDSVGEDTISLGYKGQVDTIPVDIVLWTVGIEVSDMIRQLPLPQNARGQLITTPTLQVKNTSEVFALGDIADCHDAIGQQVPGTAQAAFQQSDYCAWNLWASLTQRPLLPFRYQQLGEIMSLGMDNATINSMGLKVDGPLAHTARRLIYLYRMPTAQHRLTVGVNWVADPLRLLLSQVS